MGFRAFFAAGFIDRKGGGERNSIRVRWKKPADGEGNLEEDGRKCSRFL
jgi:hypothetical protein